MLYSHNLIEDKIDYFSNFLLQYLHGKNFYGPIIDPVINEAHSFAIGAKTIYTIDRSNLPIIVFLVEKDKPFFENLLPSNFANETYQHIYDLVSQSRFTHE